MVGSGWDKEKHEVMGGLLEMCLPDEFRSGPRPEYLDAQMSINGVPNLYPKQFILEMIRDRMDTPLNTPKMFRDLHKGGFITGPHFTSRMEDGKKVFHRLFWLNNNKLVEAQQKLRSELTFDD